MYDNNYCPSYVLVIISFKGGGCERRKMKKQGKCFFIPMIKVKYLKFNVFFANYAMAGLTMAAIL